MTDKRSNARNDITVDARDEASDALPSPGPGLNRRYLLGSSAGGFALAASGLLLPGWLTPDADAADRPLQRVQDRQEPLRQKRRNRLEQRRAQNRRDNRKSGKVPGRDIFQLRHINFIVEVSGQHAIKGDLYLPRNRPGQKDFWDLKGTKSFAPSVEGSFPTPTVHAILWLDDRILVEADNPPVEETYLKVGHGGAFWAGERGWEGGTLVYNDQLLRNQSTPAFSLNGYSIRVERLDNDDDYIRYKILLARD